MINIFVDNSDDSYYLLSDNDIISYDGYAYIASVEGVLMSNGILPGSVYDAVFKYKPELLLYGFNVTFI